MFYMPRTFPQIWDPLTGACLVELCDHLGPVTSLAISHDHLLTLAMNDGVCECVRVRVYVRVPSVCM